MQRFAKLLTWTSVCVALGLTGVCVLMTAGHWRLVPVLSGSMRPNMQVGDLAVMHPVTLSNVHVGDVIAYNAPHDDNPMTIHRVTAIRSDNRDSVFNTKGDSNSNPDPWTARLPSDSSVLVRTTSVPTMGRVVHQAAALGSQRLMLATLSLIVGALAVVFIWKPLEPMLEQIGSDANMAD